jgi:hypothetical protein
MLVNVDQMIPGGANLAIDIQRLAIERLGEALQAENMLMPRKFNFQFDNCGENKNKEMFAFCSLLVEQNVADEVRVNFLIVGW